ncbi:MAG: hypothetical protein SGJ02_13215 [bacterium]|nr:hypothetical protein [bacterium]
METLSWLNNNRFQVLKFNGLGEILEASLELRENETIGSTLLDTFDPKTVSLLNIANNFSEIHLFFKKSSRQSSALLLNSNSDQKISMLFIANNDLINERFTSFISTLTHDLKGPLGIALVNLDLHINHSEPGVNEIKRKQYLERAFLGIQQSLSDLDELKKKFIKNKTN